MIWDVSFKFDGVMHRVDFVVDIEPVTITKGWFSVEVKTRYNVFTFQDMDTANRFVALVKSIRDAFHQSEILDDFHCYRCALSATAYFGLMIVSPNERQAFYANLKALEAKCAAHINKARTVAWGLSLIDFPML